MTEKIHSKGLKGCIKYLCYQDEEVYNKSLLGGI